MTSEPSMIVEPAAVLVTYTPPPTMIGPSALAVYDFNVRGYRVIDADTQEHVLDMGFDIQQRKKNGRLFGIDTPESSTVAGKLVERYVDAWYAQMGDASAGGIMSRSLIKNYDDKYGGRYLCLVRGKKSPKSRFQELNELLVRLGLAGGDYFGGEKPPWTKERLAETEGRVRPLLAALGITV
jgi:hypothetical protein